MGMGSVDGLRKGTRKAPERLLEGGEGGLACMGGRVSAGPMGDIGCTDIVWVVTGIQTSSNTPHPLSRTGTTAVPPTSTPPLPHLTPLSHRYDCSAADINPIGGISKQDLRRFLVWGASHLGYAELAAVEAAPPTAELEPLRGGQVQQVGVPRRNRPAV